MTNAIRRTPDVTGQYTYVIAINEVDYPLSEWAHDPDISEVPDTPRIYWKWDDNNNKVIEMTESEKTIIDDYGVEALTLNGDSIQISISDNLPKSSIDGKKLSVHTSYKPEIDGSSTYAVWSGSGDDINAVTGGNGAGEMLQIHTSIGQPETSVDIRFNHARFGRVWLHEAYLKFSDGGIGDYMSARIFANGVPLQQSVSLDLIVNDTYISYSPAGPGTGTHGFADPTKITLIERSFSKDGDWDYIGNDLVPNFSKQGQFLMSTDEHIVHRFINKVPCFGNCETYFSMSSDETSELRNGYFARLTAHNVSNTEWHMSAIMELYREVTYGD